MIMVLMKVFEYLFLILKLTLTAIAFQIISKYIFIPIKIVAHFPTTDGLKGALQLLSDNDLKEDDGICEIPLFHAIIKTLRKKVDILLYIIWS